MYEWSLLLGMNREDTRTEFSSGCTPYSLSSADPRFMLSLSLTGRFWEKIEEALEKGDRGFDIAPRDAGVTAAGCACGD